jgi:hypothetical protein
MKICSDRFPVLNQHKAQHSKSTRLVVIRNFVSQENSHQVFIQRDDSFKSASSDQGNVPRSLTSKLFSTVLAQKTKLRTQNSLAQNSKLFPHSPLILPEDPKTVVNASGTGGRTIEQLTAQV